MPDDAPKIIRLEFDEPPDGPVETPRLPAAPVKVVEMVSVIVVCCGQIEYTRLCVPSVLRHSRPPFELVLIDSGSLDGTAEYLAGVHAAAPIPVAVVRTPPERGLAWAIDEGIARARSRYVVLLSNETVVTAGWLGHLVALAEFDAAIGLVGPMSNVAAPAQWTGAIPYRLGSRQVESLADDPASAGPGPEVEAVDRFAREWGERHRGQWFEANRLDSFCLLLRRELLAAVGPLASLGGALNTATGLASVDVDVLCDRTRSSGFRMACCRDLFIHHFGSRVRPMSDTSRTP